MQAALLFVLASIRNVAFGLSVLGRKVRDQGASVLRHGVRHVVRAEVSVIEQG
jgi:hypothetical protein